MAIQWVRLWFDMPTDGKFRTIAKRSKQPLVAVLSVYVLLMTTAGELSRTQTNANERGRTQTNAEIFAATLDLEIDAVEAIFKAMQGLVLDGQKLTGWETRQPLREDESSTRSKAWREAQKTANANERKRTQTNAKKRSDKDTDIKSKELPPTIPQTAPSATRGSRIAVDWEPSPENLAWAKTKCPGVDLEAATEEFKNHWLDVPGWRGCKLAWGRTWQNRISELFKRLNKSGGINAGRASQRECLTDRAARLGKLADEREAAAAAKAAGNASALEADDLHLRP